jgi:alpha-N-arabinofuranosidase
MAITELWMVPILSGRPTGIRRFYVAKLLKYFACGGDQLVSASSHYNLLTPFAAKRADGSLSVLVINKSPTATQTGNLSFTGYTPTGTINAYSYGIPEDEAARIGVDSADIAVNSYSGPATSFAYNFPPYSATVLSLNGGSAPPRLRLPQPAAPMG